MNIQNSTIINDIYKSRKQILNYLTNQGFDTSKYSSFTISEINAMKQAITQNNTSERSQLDFEVSNSKDQSHKCSVVYYLKSNIKKAVLQEMVSEYYDYDDDKRKKCCIIIVILGNINDTIVNAVKELWEKYNEYCIVFDISSLQYNILEHDFVPKHEKVSKEDKIQLFDKFHIQQENQLPEISMFDPVAKTIMLRPGDICKITRYDKISFENIFYRMCVI